MITRALCLVTRVILKYQIFLPLFVLSLGFTSNCLRCILLYEFRKISSISYDVNEERVQSLKGKTIIAMYNSTLIDNFIIFVFDKPFIFILSFIPRSLTNYRASCSLHTRLYLCMLFPTILKSGYDAAEEASLTKPNMSPFLIFGGSVVEPAGEFCIAGEREVPMPISGEIIDAVGALMFMYYVHNLEYPKECFNTFLFLQRAILKVYDTQKVPTRVLMLITELENS